MNGAQLFNALRYNEVTRPIFVNVFAHDNLPDYHIQSPWLLICNCCPSKLPGLHWLAMYKEKDDVIELFDPYGAGPDVYDLIPFMKCQDANECEYNNIQIQSTESDVCGEHCYFFAYWRARGLSLKDIVDLFSKNDLKFNDSMSFQFLYSK